MEKENLLIVISSGDEDVIEKFPFLYSSVALEREYWKTLHLMFWGPSIKTLGENKAFQEKVLQIQSTGVSMSACIVCVEDYDLVPTLTNLNIEVNHTGELLTKALKDDSYSTLTI